MTTFKPTHRLNTGELVELEHKFINRMYRAECGLFHFENGSYNTLHMDHVTELHKTIKVFAHEEPEPLRVAPEVGNGYWVNTCDTDSGTYIRRWEGNKLDRRILAQGKAYATQEDALAADAARQKARGFA